MLGALVFLLCVAGFVAALILPPWMSEYVERQIAGWPRLVLDLSGVDFFGTSGFSTLHHINVICAQYRATWALVVGPQLRRFLKICDPDNLLPLEESVPN